LKVLILTYYWPPAGGSGVQRWLKFVKYFRIFGIEPVIYTVDNPNYPLLDESLLDDIPEDLEVLKQPIWEPNNFLGSKKKTSAGFLSSNPTLFEKVLQYIRANYFIPDARKYWVKPSVKYLWSYLKQNKIDLVISSGPPHSLHLIAQQLKEKTGVKWISDFRDPWTDIDYFHQLPLTNSSLKKHQKFEQEVLKNSDAVIVVGETMRKKYLPFNKNTYVLTNGFDVDAAQVKANLDAQFSITHIGLMNDDRNPSILWKVLSELIYEEVGFQQDLNIKLIGKVSETCIREINIHNLSANLELIDYVQHNKVLEHQRSSQVLLLAVNKVPSAKGIITGKIFEYLVSERPILAIGPIDGDLAKILKESNAGTIVGFDDKKLLKSAIKTLYKKFKEGVLKVDSTEISQYHRRNLTEKLSEIIKQIG
jgi:hypothetical protein